ncbi:hypothetical protein GGS21DRAFT_491457 [Xylaria nigripes]|nr:hypothetical protein GGS21DRAFT_491457 [Xylaria nigripes]
MDEKGEQDVSSSSLHAEQRIPILTSTSRLVQAEAVGTDLVDNRQLTTNSNMESCSIPKSGTRPYAEPSSRRFLHHEAFNIFLRAFDFGTYSHPDEEPEDVQYCTNTRQSPGYGLPSSFDCPYCSSRGTASATTETCAAIPFAKLADLSFLEIGNYRLHQAAQVSPRLDWDIDVKSSLDQKQHNNAEFSHRPRASTTKQFYNSQQNRTEEPLSLIHGLSSYIVIIFLLGGASYSFIDPLRHESHLPNFVLWQRSGNDDFETPNLLPR